MQWLSQQGSETLVDIIRKKVRKDRKIEKTDLLVDVLQYRMITPLKDLFWIDRIVLIGVVVKVVVKS